MAKEISKREILIYDLQKLPADRAAIEAASNPLERHWRERVVADKERLLNQLPEERRLVFESLIINHEKYKVVADQLGTTPGKIFAIRDAAIEDLCYLRHGAAYRP